MKQQNTNIGSRHPRLLQAGLLTACVLCVLVGAFALRTERNSPEARLVSNVDAELQDLATLLCAFRAKHGRFPTTDEGLRAIDVYAVRFGTHGEHLECWGYLFRFSHRVKSFLRGRYPDDANQIWQGIRIVHPMAPRAAGFELALSSDYGLHLLFLGEVLSPFNVPYVYFEGRAGAGSPEGPGSICIADQVSVCCPETQKVWRRDVQVVWWTARAGTVLAVLLVICLTGHMVIQGRSRPRLVWAKRAIVLVLSLGAIFGAVLAYPIGGGLLDSPSTRLRAEAVDSYRAEIAELHSEGRLTKETALLLLSYRVLGFNYTEGDPHR